MKTMKELKPVDVTATPDVLRLAKEVARSGVPVMLKTEDEDLAVLMPAAKPKRRSGRPQPVTKDDPLLQLVGSAKSGIPGGVSGRKHEFLARAYRPR
jgi:hypothetical protein